MAFNIASDIVSMASEIKVTIDTLKFGPRQITALHKMVQTGLCEGNGVPARVAQVIRRTHGAPVLKVARSVQWYGVPSDNNDFFDKMTAAVVADRMLNPNQGGDPSWVRDASVKLDRALQQRKSDGSFWFYGREFPKTLKSIVKGFAFEIEVPKTPRFVEIVVWNGEERMDI